MSAHPATSENREVKTIIRVYGALVASVLLSFVPDPVFALIATLFFTAVLITAYVIRLRSAEGSLCENHMSWIIRTIWMLCAMALVTLSAGSAYLWTQLDYAPMMACGETLGNYVTAGNTPGAMELAGMVEPCYEEFVAANLSALMIASVIAALPPLAYLAYRTVKGLGRAAKGECLTNVRIWL